MPTGITSLPCTSSKVRQLMRRVTMHYDCKVSECGLKTSQYSLLSNASRTGAMKSVELAALMKMTASTLSRNLRPLVDAGLVVFEPGADARSRLVVVTESGHHKIQEARALWKVAQQSLQSRLGEDRVRALHALIDESLELLDDSPPAVIESRRKPTHARARSAPARP